MVGRSQHLLVPRASQDWHCCSHPEVPNVTVRPLGLRLAFGKLTASHFVDVEECLFINALLSFGVNRKSSPSRQAVALRGVAEPIPADCAQGCAISLLLKAASFSYPHLSNVLEQNPTRENRSRYCL